LESAIRSAQRVSVNHPEFDQVRFIDAAGMEALRIDHQGAVVPQDRLQDKSDRGYFVQASTLPAGSLYMSALDLNVEDGQIEVPHMPMLRLAMPVFDAAGIRRGIYIVNYRGASQIAGLPQAVPAYAHRLRLLDAEGYWLKAQDPAWEWSFQLPERAALTLARTDPALWQRMQMASVGQHDGPTGAPFTWLRVDAAQLVGDLAGILMSEKPYLI